MSFSDELPGGVSRHPVAGDGPHGSVVEVVDGAAVVEVELVEDELLVDEELLVEDEVLDVLLEVDVLLVLLVDVDEVVVVVTGPPPISQCTPEMPGGHTQRKVPDDVARQVLPLTHVFVGAHGSLGSVVDVVVPAVHADEPGGANVPGGHGAHAEAAPVENVLMGQSRQAAAPP